VLLTIVEPIGRIGTTVRSSVAGGSGKRHARPPILATGHAEMGFGAIRCFSCLRFSHLPPAKADPSDCGVPRIRYEAAPVPHETPSGTAGGPT